MFRRKRLTCSFCGKGEAEVAKLVAGPKVFICDKCVTLARKIMEEDSGNQPQAAKPKIGLLRRLMRRSGGGNDPGIHRLGDCEAISH